MNKIPCINPAVVRTDAENQPVALKCIRTCVCLARCMAEKWSDLCSKDPLKRYGKKLFLANSQKIPSKIRLFFCYLKQCFPIVTIYNVYETMSVNYRRFDPL